MRVQIVNFNLKDMTGFRSVAEVAPSSRPCPGCSQVLARGPRQEHFSTRLRTNFRTRRRS